jgi:enoyl-CoA hydratase/carnithine racemase
MLSDEQSAKLDQLWDELHFVSQDAFALVDAYEQLWQFATQDADPSAFTPMREGIVKRADEFKQQLLAAEPKHLQAVLDFANRAWRRPMTNAESKELKGLYEKLRTEELPHATAVRLLLSRVLVSPAFLYRGEAAATGKSAGAVRNHELASRLSYFLWSSLPDQELLDEAASNRLHEPQVLRKQMQRMMSDGRMRRMAIEFGCQWLHIREFDKFDEKSETHFPEFAELKSDMYEESILFFEDMFRNDGSVLDLLNADHTFLNARLAKFYGMDGVEGDWERVEGTRKSSRGGILSMASTMAKQSGASRTSPILRGNWVSEFLLGEKLSAAEAFAKGIYTRLFSDQTLREETLKAAHRLADGPRMGFRYMKQNLNNAEDWAFEAALDQEALNMTLSTQATAAIWKAQQAAKKDEA